MELPDRKKSPDDPSPLIACFVAFAAATQARKTEKKIYESSYANGGSLIFV